MDDEKRQEKAWEMLKVATGVEPSADFKARFWERVRREQEHQGLWDWLTVPRFVRLALGVAVLWALGAVFAVEWFENHLRRPTPTEMSLRIFASPLPQNSIEEAYWRGRKV